MTSARCEDAGLEVRSDAVIGSRAVACSGPALVRRPGGPYPRIWEGILSTAEVSLELDVLSIVHAPKTLKSMASNPPFDLNNLDLALPS